MSGYGNGQGYPPPQGGYPPYNNNNYTPPPSFPSPNLYPPTSNQYPSSPNSDSLQTPHHQQSSSSTSSLTPEFPQPVSTSASSSPSISQNNSNQFNQQFSSNQFNSNQFNSNQFSNSGQFTVHIGAAPLVQPRRYKTQRVKLTEGNVVFDCRVPSKLTASVPLNSDDEFTKVRYTACTCDPDFFQEEKYTLRQQIIGRQTEIFIVITMYNEEAELFARTFYGVVKNIHKLCQRDRSRVWGKDGWEKVVVCVVSDGRSKIDKRTEDYLAAIGVYQKGIAKEKINDKKVTAHIYEYTTQICLDDKMKPVGEKVGYTPIQVLFCLKEKNQKKINSHRWFFNAFGRILQPNICILLDAGTKPGGNSIYHLWKAFDTNSNIGGACGEIVAMKGPGGKLLLNPLVAAQNFEYKMSNILDKPLESVFGYITVLPGAFSAYRYVALQNEYDPVLKKEVGPLASYFMGEKHHGGGPPKRPKKKTDPNNEKSDDEEEEEEEINTGLFTANMYLAEDRILCFELVSKRNSSWVLHYVKSAYAETDVPNDIIELIRQRRRWLNGSFFAGLYAICHTSSIWRSHHTAWKKFVLLVEMIYQTFNLAFSWFALGNLYLAFHILGNSLASDETATDGLWSLTVGAVIFRFLQAVYIALIGLQFSLALGNKPQSARWAYIFSTAFFAVLMFYMLFGAAWVSYKGVQYSQATVTGPDVSTVKQIFGDNTFRNVVIALLSTYGLYIIASFLFFEPYHMFHSSIQYLLLTPFYVNILNVYAFCNIHDVSWGTKGDTKAEKLEHGQVIASKKEATLDIPEDVDEEYERVQNSLGHEPEQPRPLSDYSSKELKELLATQTKDLSKYKLDKLSADDIKKLPTEDLENIQKLQKSIQSIQERAGELQEESNSMFRTYLVFAWMISNGILVGVVTTFVPNLDTISITEKSNVYFAFILWSVTALAAFRFFGSCVYLILRLFNESLFDGLIK